MVNVVLDNIAPFVVFQLKVDVFETLGHPVCHLISHGQIEHKDFLFTVSIENTISLILCQITLCIIFGKDFFIFFFSSLIAIINCLGYLFDV
jgi:hypothetical protein